MPLQRRRRPLGFFFSYTVKLHMMNPVLFLTSPKFSTHKSLYQRRVKERFSFPTRCSCSNRSGKWVSFSGPDLNQFKVYLEGRDSFVPHVKSGEVTCGVRRESNQKPLYKVYIKFFLFVFFNSHNMPMILSFSYKT